MVECVLECWIVAQRGLMGAYYSTFCGELLFTTYFYLYLIQRSPTILPVKCSALQ